MRNGCSHPSAYVYAPAAAARVLVCADCGLPLGAASGSEPPVGQRRLARIDREGRLLGWRGDAEPIDDAALAAAAKAGIARWSG